MESTHRNAGPRLVLGVDEFAACAKRADEIGKWNAWRDLYFEPFEKAFRPMLEVVYRCGRDDLKPYVEGLDFDAALSAARRFIAEDGVARVRKAFSRCIDVLPPVASFPVYLLVGIGHANGMALPADEPYVFLGLECCDGSAAGLDGLIAHEYNHLVRVQTVYGGMNPTALTVGDFVISEGLATVFALRLLGEQLTPERIARSISNLDDPAAAAEREPTMRADVLAHWDRFADREMIVRFIESGTAYLVGGCMIAGLIEDGESIAELTRTPTVEIARRIVDRDEPTGGAT